MADAARQGRRNRRRGQTTEREAVHALALVYPDARRATQWRGGRQEGCDVEDTPWWVEVRHRARHGCLRHLEGAEEESDGRPVVVWLREQGDPRAAVLLRADVFLGLLAERGGAV